MNGWVQEQLYPDVLSPAVCTEMLERCKALQPFHWVKVDRAMGKQGYAGAWSRYAYVTQDSVPKELADWIWAQAPKNPAWELGRFVVNRYRVGEFIGLHKDRGTHDLNLIIPLQTGEDGVSIEDVLYPDVVGNGRLHIYNGKPHCVPPVKTERYVVIYLYKEVGIHDQG